MTAPVESPVGFLASADEETRRLWQQLRAFSFGDESVAFDFAGRLARDNGWSPAFAQRAIDEYRRFLFLGQIAGHPITPSDEVDQVWHLHLTYTRSYWDDLCVDVLGAPFHHGPTKGGESEDAKFDDWYDRTLASYEAWFGSPPPTDWWPAAERRFGDAPYFVRLNTRDTWLLPKLGVGRGVALVGGTVAAGLLLAGCSGGLLGLLAQAENWSGGEIALGLAICAFVMFVLWLFKGGPTGGGGSRGGGEGSGFGEMWGGDSSGCGSSGCGSSGCGGGGCGGAGCGSG